MSEWVIAPCAETDKPQLVEVCKQQWTYGESIGLPELVVRNIESAYTFEQYVEDTWGQMKLAKAGDQVVGFIFWDGNDISGTGVLPSWWRRGVGRALMAYAEDAMHAEGTQTARLEVYESNVNAVQFYKAIGYHVADSFINNDWGAPVTTLVMTKPLTR